VKIYRAQIFDDVIPVSFKKPIVAWIVLMLASATASSNGVQPGFVEGHFKIASLGEVEPSDAMPRQTFTAKTYAEYPLIVLSQDGQKEIARVTADGNGNYRVSLPPGDYIMDVQDRVAKRVRANPQPFTVVSNQTIRVDMSIVIGFR
jgi:hypothetical protein